MHLHITGEDKVIKEVEGFLVLDLVPVIRDDIDNSIITATNQSGTSNRNLLAGDLSICRNLSYCPVKTGCLEHLGRGQVSRNLGTKAVPGGLSGIGHLGLAIEHFNHVCHATYSCVFVQCLYSAYFLIIPSSNHL